MEFESPDKKTRIFYTFAAMYPGPVWNTDNFYAHNDEMAKWWIFWSVFGVYNNPVDYVLDHAAWFMRLIYATYGTYPRLLDQAWLCHLDHVSLTDYETTPGKIRVNW